MPKHSKPQSHARKATPAPAHTRARRSIHYLKLLLKGFVPVTLLIGAWIYWPRDARPFVPGLGIEAECSMSPEISINAKITDTKAYQIDLDFGDLSRFSCTELKIVVPMDLIDVIQVHDIPDVSPEAMRKARTPFTNFRLHRNSLQQPVLNISTPALGSEPFILELLVRGIISVSFDKFRLLIPKAIDIYGEPKLSIHPRVTIDSIVIPPQFDTLNVTPKVVSRTLQMSWEILSFKSAEFSEINILFLDRARNTLKAVFNAFALAVAMSVLAATISRLSQSSKGEI